jgi:cytochrome c oxidase subunit 3
MKNYSLKMEQTNKTLGMNPKKFALWLFIVSIVMMFAAMTSAYIVRRSEGNWLIVNIPIEFYISTIIILLSSLSMHFAYISAKKDNFQPLKYSLLTTSVLGVLFILTQYMGWQKLVEQGVLFGGIMSNPGGSFVYVLTGLHVFHLFTGIVFLFVVLIAAFKYKVHSKNLSLIEMCSTYWHFLDGLWVYLFVFLLLNH